MKLKLLIMVILFSLLSCTIITNQDQNENSDDDQYISINFNEDLYQENYKKWVAHGFHNYDFTQEYFSGVYGPLPEVKIIVLNDQLSSKTIIDNVHGLDEDDIFYYETIDAIYEKINNSYEAYKTEKKSDNSYLVGVTISVSYDEVYNYPESVSIYGLYNTSIDGGIGTNININDFNPID